MKVLSAHAVSKPLAQSLMEPISMPPSAVLVKPEVSPSQHANASLTSVANTGNMNINQRRWKNIFHRVQKKNLNSAHPSESPTAPLFGRALSDICEKNGSPPKPIMEVLMLLLRKGPYTEGVFRKAGNARALKEIKTQLNDGKEVDLKDQTVFLLADLIKDFLRHLPGSLLRMEHYKSWVAAMEKQEVDQKCAEIQTVIQKLPEPNTQLLKLLIVLLHRISENSDTNKMDSSNLAVCVSPNLLQTDNMEDIKEVTKLTQFLIDNCSKIFGEGALTLFGDSDEDDFSDNQDSLSSHHHDSAYDSNDLEGSYSDMDSIKSGTEVKTQEGSTDAEPWTTKILTRRRSEPTFVFNKCVQQHLALTRSQTQMDFHDKLLGKQISDSSILFRWGKGLEKSCGLMPQSGSKLSCEYSYCSSSSLESCCSSASESSIHSTPVTCSQKKALQRKHSFPTRHPAPTFRRSQSMKSAHLRSRTVFGRSGSTKRAIERTLRHSQTLPEVLNPKPEPIAASYEPRRLSSEEVFHQVDSRVPSEPPSYRQAIEDSFHPPLTVEDARCLSKQTGARFRSASTETLNSCRATGSFETLYEHDKDCCDGGSCSGLRQRSVSECMYEDLLPDWRSQDVRETCV